MDIAAILTAIAALITAGGHAWNCQREISQLKSHLADERARFERFAGDLSAFEKALDESGRFRVPEPR